MMAETTASTVVPTFNDVLAALDRISPYLQPTALNRYPALDQLVGTETWVKHENHQSICAFKIRGGINLVSHLSNGERRRGVVTASTGNHRQSVAYIFGQFIVPEPLPGLGVVGAVDGDALVDGPTSGDTLGDGDTPACTTSGPNPPARPIPAAPPSSPSDPETIQGCSSLDHLPGGYAMADRHRVEHGDGRLSEIHDEFMSSSLYRGSSSIPSPAHCRGQRGGPSRVVT